MLRSFNQTTLDQEQPIEDPDGRENGHSEDTNEAFWVLTNSEEVVQLCDARKTNKRISWKVMVDEIGNDLLRTKNIDEKH
ncbi:13496_t:CDS:2 [Funneliformis caledonium]|uniref:13496_t:CDS:1 n=1 Tax=Funneliformis caledonium TaxID=1117310 RepID=A0A9N9CPV2_9GLOM|nr:13496_t:CDS:2 [Funneliformis caledonium]